MSIFSGFKWTIDNTFLLTSAPVRGHLPHKLKKIKTSNLSFKYLWIGKKSRPWSTSETLLAVWTLFIWELIDMPVQCHIYLSRKGDCLSLCLVLIFLILTSSLLRRLWIHYLTATIEDVPSSCLVGFARSLMGWRDISQSKTLYNCLKTFMSCRVTMLLRFVRSP